MPFNKTKADSLLSFWLFLALCILTTVSFFLPWIQLEVVPVQGRYLPELAYEQYGSGHLLYYLSFLYFGLPLWAIFSFWRLLIAEGWPTRWEIVALVFWLLTCGGFLLYTDLTSVLTLQLREGYYIAVADAALLTVLTLRHFKAANTTS